MLPLLEDTQEQVQDDLLAGCPFPDMQSPTDGQASSFPQGQFLGSLLDAGSFPSQLKTTCSQDIGDQGSESVPAMFNGQTLEFLKQQLNRLSGNTFDMPPSLLPRYSMSLMHSRRGSIQVGEGTQWPINRNLFQTCFPFHIIFDKDLVIRYMGVSFMRIFPKAIVTGARLSDYFILNRPTISLTHANICSAVHNIFILSADISNSKSTSKNAIQFRGQMIPTSSREGADILFVGSPRINSVEELEYQGLYLSDIPVHDVTRDLILLNQHFHVERNIAAELQETKCALEVQKSNVEREKHRADMLLHSMLPPSVANELKMSNQSTAMDYDSITILFSDIKGFTNICNSCDPFQVVGMLNSLYSLFDDKSELHNVYKVIIILECIVVTCQSSVDGDTVLCACSCVGGNYW